MACPSLPVPPPPPRPRRRFVRAVEKPLLRFLHCSTFVRLIRRLLGMAQSHGNLQSWWNETLSELVINLIIVALYEDAIAFA